MERAERIRMLWGHQRKRNPPSGRSVVEAQYMVLDPCAYCGGPGEEWDHVDPLSRGGENEVENLTRTCARCNLRKKDRPLLFWLACRTHKGLPPKTRIRLAKSGQITQLGG